MSSQSKEIVRNFYNSNFIEDKSVLHRFFHPEIELLWNSRDGLSILHFDELAVFFDEVRKSYSDLRIEISHLLAEDNFVTIRYKYYVRPIENADEEMGIAHFISVWEIKDGKFYRGHQISQPVTEMDDTTESYKPVKI